MVLVGVFDVVEHAGVSAPADVGEGVPEGEGVGFVALDEGREAAGARAFRFLDQPAREAVTAGFRSDCQAIDVAAPRQPSQPPITLPTMEPWSTATRS